MKRIVFPLAIAFAVALPAQAASGATRTYTGGVQPNGEVEFQLKVKKKGNKRVVRKVKQFTFREIPITCAEGEATTSGRIIFAIKLDKQRRFDARAGNETGSSVRVRGKIKRRSPSARGTVRVFGRSPLDDEPDSGTHCDTGVLEWRAVRQPRE